jgi:hypothetical protein
MGSDTHEAWGMSWEETNPSKSVLELLGPFPPWAWELEPPSPGEATDPAPSDCERGRALPKLENPSALQAMPVSGARSKGQTGAWERVPEGMQMALAGRH